MLVWLLLKQLFYAFHIFFKASIQVVLEDLIGILK